MPRRTACLVGTSFIGAPYRAYAAAPAETQPHALDFVGTGSRVFAGIRIADGRFTGTRFHAPEPMRPVSAFDAFVVYADLPSPYGIVRTRKDCAEGRVSSQVAAAALADSVGGSGAMQLVRTLKAATAAPVFVVSSNIRRVPGVEMNEAVYLKNERILEQLVAPAARYIPFPAELFDARRCPRAEYYKDSLKLRGEPAGDADHDCFHMNAQGGALVLAAIFRALDRL